MQVKIDNEKASYGDLKELTELFSKNYPGSSLRNWKRITKNYLSDDDSYVFLCRKSDSIVIASCYISTNAKDFCDCRWYNAQMITTH